MYGRTAPADLVPTSRAPYGAGVRARISRVRSGVESVWADVQG